MTTVLDPNRATPAPAAPRHRSVLLFTAIALPVGWIMLTLPMLLALPAEPFVLATTILGLFLPALLITARHEGRAAVRTLLRQAVRPNRWVLGAVALPVVVWLAGAATGGAQPLTAALVGAYAVQFLSSALIINIWEELAWTGFVQRRLMARWGLLGGSAVTAGLFALIHLPLAFAGADTADDVLTGLGILVSTGLGLRLLIAAVDRWSAGSLLAVGLLHGAFNASAALLVDGSDWVRLSVTAALGATAALMVARRAA